MTQTEAPRYCRQCGKPLVRPTGKDRISGAKWRARRLCSPHCPGRFADTPDHNAARWLDVRHLEAPQVGGCWHGPGWYVVRTCPCHRDHPVTLPLKSITDAYRAKAAMLEVSGD